MKWEGLPFNYAQIDFLFEAFDRRSRDKLIDESDWSFMFSSLKDSKLSPSVRPLRQGGRHQKAACNRGRETARPKGPPLSHAKAGDRAPNGVRCLQGVSQAH